MPKVKPKQIDPSVVNGYVLTTSAGTVTWGPISPTSFTGNTSGTCITDLYVQNLHSCSPLYIQPINGENTIINLSGGSVGIGTNSPLGKLDVQSTTSSGEKILRLYSTDWATVGERERFYLTQGAFYSRANTYTLDAATTGGSVTLTMEGDNATFNLTGPTFGNTFQIINNNKPAIHSNNSGFIATTASWLFDPTNSINPDANAHIKGFGSTSATFGLKVENSSGVPSLQVRDDGNVGIGTTLPLDTLQVGLNNGTSTMNLNGGNGLSSTLSVQGHLAGSGYLFDMYNASGNRFFIRASQNGDGAGTNAAVEIMARNGSDPALSIWDYNNTKSRIIFGVGFAGDDTVLSSRIDIASSGSDGLFGWTNTLSGVRIDSDKGLAYANPFLLMTAYSGGPTTYLGDVKISSYGNSYFNGGNVGIGTTTPGERLEVLGKTKTTTIQITSGGTSGYVLTSDASGNGTWQPATGGGSGSTIVQFTGNTSATCITDIYVTNVNSCSPLHIQPVNTGDVYISENGGNVGVGTTSPNTRLDINGDIAHRSTTSPGLIQGQNDDVSTAGTSYLRISGTDPADFITGFADGYDGKKLILSNVGGNTITLINNDNGANSNIANQMLIYRETIGAAGDYIMQDGSTIELIYDGVESAWRFIGYC